MVRQLSGGNDRLLVGHVSDQIGCAGRGVDLARRLADGQVPSGQARQIIAEIEHEGDARRSDLIGRLRGSVTSPVDREDLFRVSRGVDDVLDAVRDFVREFDLFDAVPLPLYGPVLDRLADALVRLDAAVALLVAGPREAALAAVAAKKPGVRAAYQVALADALAEPVVARQVATVLLLGRLDVAGQRLAAAADALADGVMKRFQ
ncbi:MAG: DUF47 family protein [Hamadaea sp.]|uniref:DUF47 domain-containing protein n=1 Tax=Hamadaea sp. TaxID=2024425 RepID=UPI001822F4A3|nr:DUF47 family protein [Hamadaea sp.]NUR47919.1 DUF47 family protein [Hamadaea sp.]NUT18931.1 DUF47 family protein [Hamadaea sp.]